MAEQFDVIVVGGGPTGMTTAAEIASLGARVVVLEKRSGNMLSRAGTLLPRPMELFDLRGIADRFIRRATEINPSPLVPAHVWGGVRPITWDPMGSRYGFTMFVPQNITNGLLADWAIEKGAEVRIGWTVVSAEDLGDRVEVEATDGDGARHTLRAQYLVGADGVSSTVREQAGIDFVGHDTTFTGLIADVVLAEPLPAGTVGGANQKGWTSTFPVGEGRTRFVMIHEPQMGLSQDTPVTEDNVRDCVRDVMDIDIDIQRVDWSSRYGDQMRIASQLRKGRVFLVGEAARIHYPASGIGMNFCIQDAFNLGWKLGYVLSGAAPESLLNTYEDERRPVAEALLDSVRAQIALQFNFSDEGMALKKLFGQHLAHIPEVARHLGLDLNGLTTRYPSTSVHPLVGHPVIDIDLIGYDGSASRVAEHLREQSVVVFDLGGGVASDALPSSSRVRLVRASPRLKPDTFGAATVVVVRPDGYVMWAADGADVDTSDLTKLLQSTLLDDSEA